MILPLDTNALGFSLILTASFAAGVLDAIAGGGGLITTPALLLLLPGAPITGILATTKCASMAGTAGAAAAYARKVHLPWRIAVPAVTAALPSAWLGARSVSALDARLLRPAILAVLVLVALYTWWRPELGAKRGLGIPLRWHPLAAMAVGCALIARLAWNLFAR
jgi:uncharacterized protein